MPARCGGESRLAAHPETHIAPNHGYFPHDLIRPPSEAVDRHVVRQFGHAVLGQEPGDENARVRKIHLAHARIRELGTNLEAPTLLIVYQSSIDSERRKIPVGES